MSNDIWNDFLTTQYAEDESKVSVEKASVNLDCVKKEIDRVLIEFEENLHVSQYRVTLEYENIFGAASRNLNEYEDNLIGFEDNEVVMENVIIKLEDIKEEEENYDYYHCSKCQDDYDGYCLKCSTLSHILNKTSPNTNPGTGTNTAPTGILEIRHTSVRKGVFLLKTLPKDVMFGPFEGISSIKSTEEHSWRIKHNKLLNIKNGNWMKDVACAANVSNKNLDIFEIKGSLYFQTNREIMEGEELLIYYDDKDIQKSNNSEEFFYTPQKQEKLSKIFACTLCCLGFRSIKCLMEHKSKFPHGEPNRIFKELIECDCCKIWLEKLEHQEYHMDYCTEKYHRMLDSRGSNRNKWGRNG